MQNATDQAAVAADGAARAWRRVVMRLRTAVDARLPSLCPACGDWPRDASPRAVGGLCVPCAASTRVDRRLLAAACRGRCFDSAVAATTYVTPWDGWVRRLKFTDGLDLARPMAALCVRAWRDGPTTAGPGAAAGPVPAVDVVVPVPLSRERLAARGYNQAWELARRIAAGLERPAWPEALLRVRDTQAQVELDLLARAVNLDGAFAPDPRHRSRLAGAAVLLVDDVLTTGATFDAAAAALREAGVAAVHVCAFAVTPPPGDA